MDRFEKNLKKYRKLRKYSQKELGQELGIGQTTIANYERGNRKPNYDTLKQMAKALNVAIDDLIGVEAYSKDDFQDINGEQLLNKILEQWDKEGVMDLSKFIPSEGLTEPMTVQIFDDVLKPMLYTVGRHWQQGRLSVPEEHLITEKVSQWMDYISYRMKPDSRIRHEEVIVGVSLFGEQHNVGIRMVFEVLRLKGYKTYFLQGDVPKEELLKFLESKQADAVAMSITMEQDQIELFELINNIKQRMPKIQCYIGGQGVTLDMKKEQEFVDEAFMGKHNVDEVVNIIEVNLEKRRNVNEG